jgi:hypothetical protein
MRNFKTGLLFLSFLFLDIALSAQHIPVEFVAGNQQASVDVNFLFYIVKVLFLLPS